MRISVLLLTFVFAVQSGSAEDLDAPFSELGELPEATVDGFEYKLSIRSFSMQGYVMRGHWNGVTTNSTILELRGESPDRIPGDASMKFVAMKATVGKGVMDIVAIKEHNLRGMPVYPPNKPASVFRCDFRSLLLVNEELRVRIRFKDSTAHFVLRYKDGEGLRLKTVGDGHEQTDADSIADFRAITEIDNGTTWNCNALSIWATKGDKVLWSTDIPMEGQPKSMKVLDDVLFIETTAGHSFYLRKDSGKVAFYEKLIMPGRDAVAEVLALGRKNMANEGKHRSLARYITACAVLDDRRSIPYLIDCIEKGDSLLVKAMAIAALEKFNGNPDLWSPKNPKPGWTPLGMVGMDRVYPAKNREAEMTKWREVFADELDSEAD